MAPSKSVAKVASDARKPHGVFRLRPAEVQAFLDPLPCGKLHGCGPKTAAALQEAGIRTVGDLARARPQELEARFGAHGAWLSRVARGDDPRRVDGERGERKSRGNETTFLRDEEDPQEVRRVAAGLLGEILDDHGQRDRRPFATLAVKVRYRGFETVTRARTPPHPLDPADEGARRAAADLVAALLDPLLDGRPVRLVGVRLSGFKDPEGQRALSTFGLEVDGILARRLLAPSIVRLRRPPGAFDPGGLRWQPLVAFAGSGVRQDVGARSVGLPVLEPAIA